MWQQKNGSGTQSCWIQEPTKQEKRPWASADALGSLSLAQGLLLTAQICSLLPGLPLGDRCHSSWRCISLGLGRPQTNGCLV